MVINSRYYVSNVDVDHRQCITSLQFLFTMIKPYMELVDCKFFYIDEMSFIF
jgi:hypothetical protein